MTPDMPQKQSKSTRKPIQSRSIHTKERILDSAMTLFCEKGYYKTTTNEIAHKAQVSIGSLYSYYQDKDTIFFEILERYHEKFDMVKNEILNNTELIQSDRRLWLRALINKLIQVHEETKELNRELNVVSYYHPQVAEILAQNKKKTMDATIGYFAAFSTEQPDSDMDAAATVTFDLISATVDRIVFGNNEIDRDRLIDAAIELVYKYFIDERKFPAE